MLGGILSTVDASPTKVGKKAIDLSHNRKLDGLVRPVD